jgi:hypothetical protein
MKRLKAKARVGPREPRCTKPSGSIGSRQQAPLLIRKRIKAQQDIHFHHRSSKRSKRHAEIDPIGPKKRTHIRGSTVFALRSRRKKLGQARLLVSGSSRRRATYINAPPNAKDGNRPSSDRIPVSLRWPYLNIEPDSRVLTDRNNAALSDRATESQPTSTAGLDVTSFLGVDLPSESKPNDRQSVTVRALEARIAEAVRAIPGCEAFVGVVITRIVSKSSHETNWYLRGIKFGKSNRDIASQGLVEIVARAQSEFEVSDVGQT